MRKTVAAVIAMALIGVTPAVFAATKLDLFSSPGGAQIGTYSGPVTVLTVEGDWVAVRMTAWIPREEAAQVVQLPTSENEGYSRVNPAPIGTTLPVEYSELFDRHKAAVTLLEIMRGEEAWQLLQDANMFNDPPDPGFEYILARIRFNYLEGSGEDKPYEIYGSQFKAFSGDGCGYDTLSLVEPKPVLEATLYPGASCEGWVVFQVKEDDKRPLLTFERESYGKGKIWFKLYY